MRQLQEQEAIPGDGNRPPHRADTAGNYGKQLRDAWHVENLTEREKVASYEVIRRVQGEGRRPPLPENHTSVETTQTT